jgi:hypothetical protein
MADNPKTGGGTGQPKRPLRSRLWFDNPDNPGMTALLAAATVKHDAVNEITHQDFDQPEIGEIAVERRCGPLAGLLKRMDGKLERYAARRDDPVANPLGEVEMMPVAGDEVRAGLGDADDRLAGAQFRGRKAVVEITLDITFPRLCSPAARC